MLTVILVVLLVIFIVLAGAVAVVGGGWLLSALRSRKDVATPRSASARLLKKFRVVRAGTPSWRLVFQLTQGGMLELTATLEQGAQIQPRSYGVVHWTDKHCTGWVPEIGGAPYTDSHSAD